MGEGEKERKKKKKTKEEKHKNTSVLPLSINQDLAAMELQVCFTSTKWTN